jgi:hypothetical protein
MGGFTLAANAGSIGRASILKATPANKGGASPFRTMAVVRDAGET